MTSDIKMRALPEPAEGVAIRKPNRLEQYGIRGKLRIARLYWAAFKLKSTGWAYRRGLLGRGEKPETIRHREGARLRSEIVALGPTFIKIGQMLSTRIDLLPVEYTEELKELLDRVPPFPTEEAFRIIERELGQPPRDIFAQIDDFPIASASLGQVYRARLRSGEEVVIKVQRPDLDARIALDLATLSYLAPKLASTGALKSVDWDAIIDEFGAVLSDETDYTKELANAERFRANFAKWDNIRVPRMYPEYSTSRVLTMEYIPGLKVDDHAGLRRMGLTPFDVAELLVKTYLKQLLEDGFFHADPHPGNLRVMPDGRLAFFDFGMVGHISLELQSQLVDAFLHIVQKDWHGLLKDASTLRFLRVSPEDTESLREIGERLIEQYQGLKLGDLAFKDLSFEVADVLYHYPFQIPAHFTFIIRALTTIEGIGVQADPEFNFFLVARPFAKDFMLRREGRYIGGKLISRVLRRDDGPIDWQKTWKLAKMAWSHYVSKR